jgi:ankyrin repeat protein
MKRDLVIFINRQLPQEPLITKNMGNLDLFQDALSDGDFEKIKKLLIVNPHMLYDQDNKGNTALQLAVEKGRMDITALLIENGAQVNAINNEGQSSLQYAAFHGYKEIVELLLANNADINIAKLLV